MTTEEKKIDDYRIGNDIPIHWRITRDNLPESFDGKKLLVFVRNKFHNYEFLVNDFAIEGNTLKFIYRGKEQRYTGKYTLTLVENKGIDNMTTLDYCQAFNMVDCSCKVKNVGTSDVTEPLVLSSDIAIGGFGISKEEVEAMIATALQPYAKSVDIPTKTSQLLNDSGFLTEHQDISGKLDKSVYDADKLTFATKSEVQAIDAKIGNINNMLDNINGEQI